MSSKIYPIGIQNFEKIRKDGYFYIDKTALIYQMVKTGSYYFLSRPRRFGKSLLISTLEAYFLGKKELFEGLAMEKLEKDYGREPTLEEVSEEIGATREEIVMAMESASEVESLHKTIYQGDGNAISLMDGIKEEKDASEELLDHMLLNSLLGTLEEKERNLLRLRYFEDLTQVQVAKQLDMTQVQVSRMEKKILGKLRERL